MAIYAPRAPRRRNRKPVSDAARRGLQLMAQALSDAMPAMDADEALAERERYRIEDEGKRSAQGVLDLHQQRLRR
ncbi:MAG: hypothetical protein ACOH1V_02370 [Stenotrophomonas sp.]